MAHEEEEEKKFYVIGRESHQLFKLKALVKPKYRYLADQCLARKLMETERKILMTGTHVEKGAEGESEKETEVESEKVRK